MRTNCKTVLVRYLPPTDTLPARLAATYQRGLEEETRITTDRISDLAFLTDCEFAVGEVLEAAGVRAWMIAHAETKDGDLFTVALY